MLILIMFLEIAGANPIDSNFISIGGLMLLIGFGIFETNLVTL